MISNEARKVGLVTVVSLGLVSGEVSLISNDRHGVISRWILATSHSNLAKEKGFATVCLFLKSDTS